MVDTTNTNDSKRSVSDLSEAGAPEIKVTREMKSAGAEVLRRCFDDHSLGPSEDPTFGSYGEHVATLVYQAMCGLDSK